MRRLRLGTEQGSGYGLRRHWPRTGRGTWTRSGHLSHRAMPRQTASGGAYGGSGGSDRGAEPRIRPHPDNHDRSEMRIRPEGGCLSPTGPLCSRSLRPADGPSCLGSAPRAECAASNAPPAVTTDRLDSTCADRRQASLGSEAASWQGVLLFVPLWREHVHCDVSAATVATAHRRAVHRHSPHCHRQEWWRMWGMLQMCDVGNMLTDRGGVPHVEETMELTPDVIRELKTVAESDPRAARAAQVNIQIANVTVELVAKVIQRVLAEAHTNPNVLKESQSYSLVVGFTETQKDEWMTTSAVAELFQVSQQQVRRWCESGKFRSVRTPGGTYRISRIDVRNNLRSGREPISGQPNLAEFVGAWSQNKALLTEIRESSEDRDQD